MIGCKQMHTYNYNSTTQTLRSPAALRAPRLDGLAVAALPRDGLQQRRVRVDIGSLLLVELEPVAVAAGGELRLCLEPAALCQQRPQRATLPHPLEAQDLNQLAAPHCKQRSRQLPAVRTAQTNSGEVFSVAPLPHSLPSAPRSTGTLSSG